MFFSRVRFFILICITAFYAFPANGQSTDNCLGALGEHFLDINNVRARILNNGGLFWRGSPHVYEIPKGNGANAMFAAGIWLGGEVNGELRIAAARYGSWEFWAGPLDENGNPPSDCSVYDRLFKVSKEDIEAYDLTGSAAPDLRDWPTGLGAPTIAPPDNGVDDDLDGEIDEVGEQLAFDISEPLANRVTRVIDLAAGERPAILGDQSIWWVMNDRGNTHETTDRPAMGVEIHGTAFSYLTSNALNDATFYRYKIFYKGDAPLENAFFSVFADTDLGNFDDDYVGSDSLLGLGYVYNADNFDEGGEGYGDSPPALGIDIMQGPLVPSPGDTAFSGGSLLPDFKNLSMSSFLSFNNSTGVTGDPTTGEEYYNGMRGKWKDGQQVTFGGNGRDFSSKPVTFMYPGDPKTGEGWSEINPDPVGRTLPANTPADRRFVMSSGPFAMETGNQQEIIIGIIFAHGDDNLDAVRALKKTDAEIQEVLFSAPSTEISTVTQLVSPANRSEGQPLNAKLQWEPIPLVAQYELELSLDSLFLERGIQHFNDDTYVRAGGLLENTTYFWRVRGIGNQHETGPWSETWKFTTSGSSVDVKANFILGFAVTSNASGPIDPWEMGVFAFNNNGFPTLEENGINPVGSAINADRPTRGVQQSTSDAAWGIHTGGGGRSLWDNDDGQSFLERSVRNGFDAIGADDYEWRFTQACIDTMDGDLQPGDCLAYAGFEDQSFFEIPFQLWNVGTNSDDSDDYQMIPVISEASVGAGTNPFSFDLGITDHDVSGNSDDPYTDWVYWYHPEDTTSGTVGHDNFFFGTDDLGLEAFGRMVLVNWNGGETPPDSLLGIGERYISELPEPGTTFRIITSGLQAPFPSAPVNGSFIVSNTVTARWDAATSQPYHVQLSTDASFDPLFVTDFVGIEQPAITFTNLTIGNVFYWRVRLAESAESEGISEWSESWMFTTSNGVSKENPLPGFPDEFILAPNYPNPFASKTVIRYGLPAPSTVDLTVYDALGREVHALVRGQQTGGWHEIEFDAELLPAGVYFYRLEAGQFSKSQKLIIIK